MLAAAKPSYHRRWLAALLALSFPFLSYGLPQKLGDLDQDGRATALDLVRLINHLNRSPSFPPEQALFADLNQDGFVNDTDAELLADAILGLTVLPELPLTHLRSSSPAHGEGGVSVRRETVLRFSLPLAPAATFSTTNLYATFGGRKILSRVELSTDRQTATLFYLEPLPGSARIRVTFDSTGLRDFIGRLVDGNADGAPGGVNIVDFDTLSVTALPQTAVIGQVFASEHVGGTAPSNFVNRPLQGVTITVDGMEETLRTTTDAQGRFRLEPSPAGRFFVRVDGRTAVGSQWPNGSYYPEVGKAWEAVANATNNLAGGNGVVYLPLVIKETLQPVSQTADTTITFPSSVTATNPSLAGVTITVPANALFSENGARGGRVGIAPVPPDRLPEGLPPGLNFPLVITIQTDGPQNFDRPVPVRFPNLPDPNTGVKHAYPVHCQTTEADISFTARAAKTSSRRVDPLAVVERCVGGWHGVRRKAQDRVERCHRVESPVEAEDILVEVCLQMLLADAVVCAKQPCLEV